MTVSGIDTLAVAKDLKAAGFATTADLKADLATTKAELQAAIAETKADILKCVVSTIGVQTVVILGAIVTLLRMMH